jgi:hypothetical protein
VTVPEPSSRLWRDSLGSRGGCDLDRQARDHLRVSLAQVRSDSEHLAERISQDLPEFTNHDGHHLDALWPLVDLVAGENVTLTPTEAWVLGVAIVLHDLGLAVAAYPGGREDLRSAGGWPDARAAALRARLGRAPTREELAAEQHDLDVMADATVLRQRHAERAAELVSAQWDGEMLVNDRDLRNELGATAGRIAASHWWAVEDLAELGELEGAPAGMPGDWTVRPILLAVLLRIADAAHLDAGRTPRFARAIRHPVGDSALHWEFQDRLRQPMLHGDRLRFVSNRPFPMEHAEAWWLCLDHLRFLDDELRTVDPLLQAHNLPRLAARSVQGVRDPMELARVIRPEGWEPVDAAVEVSDVNRLIQRLGGNALYGTTGGVPVRELLQNASDAIKARQALQPGFEGAVDVRVDEDLEVLAIRDFGVGMGTAVLTGALLDFGRSLWESEELAAVLPGLQAAGFQPTGRFGIGFFSVFMWADEVEVLSRPWRSGEDETKVLSFSGKGSRPLLRLAMPSERLTEPGTLVRLRCRDGSLRNWIRVGMRSNEGGSGAFAEALRRRLGELAPAFPADLYAACGDSDRLQVLKGEDWVTMPAEDLLGRIQGGRSMRSTRAAASRLDLIGPEHAPAGRAALDERYLSAGVLVAGGLRVASAPRLAGVVIVDQVDAARNHGITVATPHDVTEWATRQAEAVSSHSSEEPRAIAAMVQSLGGSPGSLPVAACADGPLRRDEIAAWAADRDVIAVLDVLDAVLDARDVQAIPPEPVIKLSDEVLDVKEPMGPLPSGFAGSGSKSLFDEIIGLVALGWDCDEEEIGQWETERDDLFDVSDAEPVLVVVNLLVRPGSAAALSY